MSVRDNYGGQWVKQFTNFIRKITLKGIQKEILLRNCYLELGLKTNKTKEFLADLEELQLITENLDGVIMWTNPDVIVIEPKEKKQTIEDNPDAQPYLKAKKKLKKEQLKAKEKFEEKALEERGKEPETYLGEGKGSKP